MFGIPALAKAHPGVPAPPLNKNSYRGPNNNNNNYKNNNQSSSYSGPAFEHVEQTKARTLPRSNHTLTNIKYNDDNEDANNNNEISSHVVTGRRRAPIDNPSYPGHGRNGGPHSVPWAESAPSAPTTSTTQEMYQTAEDRDRNYRKHLRKQFRHYHLEHLIPSTLTCQEEEVDLEQERKEDEEQEKKGVSGIPDSSARRFVGKTALGSYGATDLKLTTIPNTKKKTFSENRIAPGTSGHGVKFCSSIDELGQANEKEGKMSSSKVGPSRASNGNGASRIHNENRKVHIQPFMVYEDQVSHLPAVPQVGITYTARDRPEDSKEVVFPWDRPRVGADGAAKLARRENRRLVTQRRLEFAEQFLPEICAGMTSSMSKRVAEQFEANRGVAQPLPLSLEPLDNGNLRGPTQIANNHTRGKRNSGNKNADPFHRSGRKDEDVDGFYSKKGLLGLSVRDQKLKKAKEPQLTSEEERQLEKDRIRAERKKKAEEIKQRVKDIVEGHDRSLKTHDLMMQVAATSLV